MNKRIKETYGDREKIALFLGYENSEELIYNITKYSDEMYQDKLLEKFCNKHEDIVTLELYNMFPEILSFIAYRKILSSMVIEQLEIEHIKNINKNESIAILKDGRAFTFNRKL